MNDLFDELLAICLDRLADGDTIADCLADFPECPELQPLLEVADALMGVPDDVQDVASSQSFSGYIARQPPDMGLLWTA